MKKISLILSILFLLTSCGIKETNTSTSFTPTPDSGNPVQGESAPAI